MRPFYHAGKYSMLMFRVFARPEKGSMYWKEIMREIDVLGIESLGITIIISMFMGAVITLQTASDLENPLIPLYLIGYTTKQSMILEFSPTILSLILAGKVGSRIASEIGTMQVTEQIDALEIMGVNSASFLILPKIIASVLINPFLVVVSMFVGIGGGWIIAVMTNLVSPQDFQYGLLYEFRMFIVYYALIKTVVFAFIIASVSAYHGYYTVGGALEVGRSSTKAVVHSSIMILLFNLIITQLLLI
ncbi:MAG: ABC transporter permease [Bacteroidetes bacterium]|nr:ABC transporter permease [Bacteroidota bacterium]MBU1720783.1 ABC transporter permease [Bacteroidota bacterium]